MISTQADSTLPTTPFAGDDAYKCLSRAGGSEAVPGLAAPLLPTEVRRPWPTLRVTLARCSTRQRARVALAVAQQVAALHEDGVAVGRLDPESVCFGMTGYPEITTIGLPQAASSFTAPELRDDPRGSHASGMMRRADSYALGALVYFIITDKEPPPVWSAREFAELSPAAAAIVWRAVASDPRERPTTLQVAEALDQAGPEQLRSVPLSAPFELFRRKSPATLSVASVMALLTTASLLAITASAPSVLGALGMCAMLVGTGITVAGG